MINTTDHSLYSYFQRLKEKGYNIENILELNKNEVKELLEISLDADINNIAFLEYMKEQEEKAKTQEENTVKENNT